MIHLNSIIAAFTCQQTLGEKEINNKKNNNIKRWHTTSTDSSSTSHPWRYNPFKFLKKLQWFHIPISLGLAFIAFQQFRHVCKREQAKIDKQNGVTNPLNVASDIEMSMYKMLPLRTISRWWGWINSVELPYFLRSPILGAYSRSFGCNVNEAMIDDLKQYRNLGDFFKRELKPGVRPISSESGIVSPADGTILHFGKANKGKVEQVKGITYSLRTFLGPQNWNENKDNTRNETAIVPSAKSVLDNDEYQRNLLVKGKTNNNTDLYNCTIYLAPGDYHRFHSPAKWKVNHRRHFPGELLSVRASFANWFPGLFSVNERVVYTGEWDHGFFSMTAVGATNVGSIKDNLGNELTTNQKLWTEGSFADFKPEKQVIFNKGDEFGQFNLGSTIVLVFEGPKNMQFKVKPGQKVKYGQLIGAIADNSRSNKSG